MQPYRADVLLAEVTVLAIHDQWSWVVIVANAVAGLWSLAAHWLTTLRTKALWWFTTAAEVAIFVQVILGAVLVGGQGIQAPQFHMFYGFVAIITVAIIYSYREQLTAYRYLLYGLGGLFLMGLAIRASQVS